MEAAVYEMMMLMERITYLLSGECKEIHLLISYVHICYVPV